MKGVTRVTTPSSRREKISNDTDGEREIQIPCSIVLLPTQELLRTSPDAAGAAIIYETREPDPRRIHFAAMGAGLPDPAEFGDFDGYEAVLFKLGVISFQVDLGQATTTTWAGDLIGVISSEVTPDYRVDIRPINRHLGANGPVVLTGSFAACRLPQISSIETDSTEVTVDQPTVAPSTSQPTTSKRSPISKRTKPRTRRSRRPTRRP